MAEDLTNNIDSTETIELTSEELIKYISENIENIKTVNKTLSQHKEQSKKILDMLRFYIGKEILQIDTVMTVNLHRIHSENITNTNVNMYRKQVTLNIIKYEKQIEEGNKALSKLNIQLKEQSNGTKE